MNKTGAWNGLTQDFRTVLVVPPRVEAGIALISVAGPEHLGIAYLAAALRRAGGRVSILNFDLETYIRVMNGEAFLDSQPPVAEMAKTVLGLRPGLVGISVTGPTLETALAIASELKKSRPDLHVTLGGHQATAAAGELLGEETAVDSIGLGDCDFTIVELARRLSRGESLEGMWGFIYRRMDGSVGGGWPPGSKPGVLVQPGCPSPDPLAGSHALAALPFPARDDLERVQERTGVHEARMSTSRGCMDFCTFCATSATGGFRRHALRPASDVLAEMEELYQTYGIDHFWFIDDNYVSRDPASQARAAEMAGLLIERRLGLTMRAYFRADAFSGRDDLLPLLFLSGVVTGLIGVESGSVRRLRYLGKRCLPEQARATVAQVREVGMGLQIGFILYDPLTSFEDLKIDARFVHEIGEAYLIFNLVQNMDVYPGTAFRRILERKGLSRASHPYRGGFRQYQYEDPRIAPLGALMERLYEPPLIAADRTVARLRVFHVPRLRWLAAQGLLPASAERRAAEIGGETEELCQRVGKLHYGWTMDSIDHAEAGLDEKWIRRRLATTLTARRPLMERLSVLLLEAGRLVEDHLPPLGARQQGQERREERCSTH